MNIIYKSSAVIIREFLPEESILFTSLFEDEEVTKYLPYRSPDQYKQMFEMALKDYRQGPFSRWAIFSATGNDFYGMCLARTFTDVPGQLEIGYTLHRKWWGKGIATEVSKALVEYCFTVDDTNEVVAVTDVNNMGSQKVLEKAGFRRLDNLLRDNEELAYFVINRPAHYLEGK